MMQALMSQPVSILLHSAPLHPYQSGIFDGDCEGNVDHAVVMTGYGTDRGVPYFLVKNSWGVAWGEGGYFRLARNVLGMGQCSCLTRGSFPVVDPAAATGPSVLPARPKPAPAGPLPPGSLYGSPPCAKEGEIEISYPAGSDLFPQGAAVCGAPFNASARPMCPMPQVGNNESTWWINPDFNASVHIWCLQGCLVDEHCPQGAACYMPPPDNLSITFCVWPNAALIV